MRAVFAATSIAIALGTAWACLPDLEIAPGPPAVCGDGFVDPTAGEECDPGEVGDAGGTSNACVNCKVTCVVSSFATFEDPKTQHCYFQPQSGASSTDAVNGCEAWGGHVVRFVDEAELALIAPMAVTSPFWIGVQRQGAGVWVPIESTYEPGWAGGCGGCFAQVDAGATAIPVDPSELAGGKCVIGQNALSQTWTQSLCSGAKDFFRQTVCEREPIGARARACGANVCLTVAATSSAKSYALLGNPATGGGLGANDAVLGCAALGGRLAVIGSPEEREQLGQALGAYFGGAISAWIGLSDTNGEWGWDPPAAGGMTPPPWGQGEPGFIDGGAARAYVAIDTTRFDSELAHAGNAGDAGGEQHTALCELP